MEIDLTSLEEKKYQQVLPTEVLSNALLLYNNSDYNSLIVIDQKNKIEGILSVDQVLKINKPAASVKKWLLSPPLVQAPTLDALAKIYIDKNIDLIPIVDKYEKVTAVVSAYKLAKDLLVDKEFDYESIVEPCPFLLYNDDTIMNGLSLVKKHGLDSVPIMDKQHKDKIIGVLSAKSLIKVFHEENGVMIGDLKGEKNKYSGIVKDLVFDTFAEYVIQKRAVYKAEELLEKMELNHTQTLFVSGPGNTLVGIIKMHALVKKVLDESLEKESGFSISVQGAPDKNIESIAYKKVNGMLKRYEASFGENAGVDGHIKFKKIEHQSRGGMFSYETEIRIEFGRGKDEVQSVSAIDWGAEKALNKAFNKLSRLLTDKRNIARDNTRETLRTIEM